MLLLRGVLDLENSFREELGRKLRSWNVTKSRELKYPSTISLERLQTKNWLKMDFTEHKIWLTTQIQILIPTWHNFPQKSLAKVQNIIESSYDVCWTQQKENNFSFCFTAGYFNLFFDCFFYFFHRKWRSIRLLFDFLGKILLLKKVFCEKIQETWQKAMEKKFLKFRWIMFSPWWIGMCFLKDREMLKATNLN